jgi:hypothetical protein
MSITGPPDGSEEDAGKTKQKIEPLYLKSHKDLIRRQANIFKRVKDNPEVARLLVLNPVLAFGEYRLRRK